MMFDIPGLKPGSDMETLVKAVGFVVVQWRYAEQSLDLMVAAIFHRFEGNPLLKRRPQNLEPKVDFLRECFAQLPELAQFKVESGALLTRFLVAGKKRNDLVHGAIANLSAEDGAFTFLKVDVKPKDGHGIRSVVLDNSDWAGFRQELLRLGKDGQSLAKRVFDSLKVRVSPSPNASVTKTPVHKPRTAGRIAPWIIWPVAAIAVVFAYMLILGIGKEAGRLGKEVSKAVPSTQSPPVSVPTPPNHSEEALKKFLQGGSDAEMAARFGLTLQEYKRRDARSQQLCINSGFHDFTCMAEVLNGQR